MHEIVLLGPRGLVLRTAVPRARRERMRGLIGRAGLERDEALLLRDTRSVHTFGMRFAIGVVCLDRDLRVLHRLSVRPGRIVLPRRGVRHVLECPLEADVCVGDELAAAQESRTRTRL